MFISINRDTAHMMASKNYVLYGAGAVTLFELLKQGKLTCDGKSVSAVSSASAGSEIQDEVNIMVINKGSPYKMRTLISRVPYKVRGISRRLMEDLEDSGMIKLEQGRFLGLIPYNRYLVTNEGRHEKLKNELKNIVIAGNRQADPDMAFLISLLLVCRILKRLFSKEEKRELREVFKSIGKFSFFETLDCNATAVLKAARDVIAAAEAAAAA